MSLFVSRVLCCPCWGTSHFSTFASDHENGKYARSFSVFAVFRRLRLCFLCYTVFLFLVINGSVAGTHYPVAGVIITVVEENHPSCIGLPCGKGHAELCSTSDLQVHSDWVIGRLPFYLQNSSGDCCSPRQRSEIVGCHACYMAQFEIGRNKELTRHISLSLRQIVTRSLWAGLAELCAVNHLVLNAGWRY